MKKNITAIITVVLLVLTGAVAFASDTMVKGDSYTLASSHEGGDMMHDHDQMMKKDGEMMHDHDQMMKENEEMKQKHMDKEHEGHDHGTKERQ